ncbi:RING finger protein 207-like [Mytilus trossulus]|uniref:RING finger protein 207-like n=1 Tax=Mytilus trossulus TaxID=6551 RepID=UPI003003EE8F
MATRTDTTCDICQCRHTSKAAEIYCSLCEEALCSDCKDHHKLSKATKTHQVILIDDFNKLPPLIREIKQHCDKHGDRFDFFCPKHNELCCKRCITTTHRECKGSKVIEDFVEFSKSSAAINEYEQTLKDVEENIQIAIDDRKINLEEFDKQTQSIRKQIQDKRTETNKHLDNLETTIINELSSLVNEKKKNIKLVLEQLEEIKNKNIQLRTNVEAMKKYGSNIQVFMGTTKLQQRVSSQERFVRSLQNDGSFRVVYLECSISEKLNSILTGIETFGTVTSKSSESRVRFSWQCDKSAQILTKPTHLKSIDNINTKLICKIDVDTYETITSCFVGKCLLFSTCDLSEPIGNILRYDREGKHLKEIQLA